MRWLFKQGKWPPHRGLCGWAVVRVCASMCWELRGGSTTVPVLAFLGGFGQGSELCKPHPSLKKLEVGFEALPRPMGGPQSPENQSVSQLVS